MLSMVLRRKISVRVSKVEKLPLCEDFLTTKNCRTRLKWGNNGIWLVYANDAGLLHKRENVTSKHPKYKEKEVQTSATNFVAERNVKIWRILHLKRCLWPIYQKRMTIIINQVGNHLLSLNKYDIFFMFYEVTSKTYKC